MPACLTPAFCFATLMLVGARPTNRSLQKALIASGANCSANFNVAARPEARRCLTDGRCSLFDQLQSKRRTVIRCCIRCIVCAVSLLTCLALDGEVPLPILSKLVAGHSRLLMTIYYTKPGVARTTQVLNGASAKLEASAAEGLQRFLAQVTYEQLVTGAAYNSLEGVQAALPVRPEERNPIGWMVRHLGICLVGGNTSPTDGNSRIGGCFNGGAMLQRNNVDPTSNRYSPCPAAPAIASVAAGLSPSHGSLMHCALTSTT